MIRGRPGCQALSSAAVGADLRTTRAAVHCALSESIDMDAVVHMAGRGHRGRWLSTAGSAGKGLCFACKRRTAAAATARANAILESNFGRRLHARTQKRNKFTRTPRLR